MEGVIVRLAAATFQPRLDTVFRAATSAGDVPLRLAEVNVGRPIGGFERFSLIFHGPMAPILPQAMYAFQHDALGAIELFIVPVLGSNAARILYEASFTVAAKTSRTD